MIKKALISSYCQSLHYFLAQVFLVFLVYLLTGHFLSSLLPPLLSSNLLGGIQVLHYSAQIGAEMIILKNTMYIVGLRLHSSFNVKKSI